MLNLVIGSDEEEQRRFGDWLDHDQRYTRASEFLTILRGAWSGEPFDYTGRYYKVVGATVCDVPRPVPEIFLGGASNSAVEAATAHADVYVMWAEPPPDIAERIAKVRERAANQERLIRYGLRAHVITRDTAEQAWTEATRMLEAVDSHAIAVAQRRFQQSTSVGQRRMTALHAGRTDNLEVYPNLWAGFGLIRRHAGTALVGSHHEVADLIEEYHHLGIDHLILSGQPHLEEAHWFAEGVTPILRQRGLLKDDLVTGPPSTTA
jgi:alkanesulfonate monooxygenase